MRIIVQPEFDGRETMAAYKAARSLGIQFKVCNAESASQTDVPIGSVEYCEKILGYRPIPDFYPSFLSSWMHRGHSLIPDGTSPDYWKSGGFFCKSADYYKEFPAHVTEAGQQIPTGNLWLVEQVNFTQEWRYYVAGGEVITTGWYDGCDDDEPAPELAIEWPTGFCGAVDFGRLSTGQIALVESHHGFACGWYGDDPELFILWQAECWQQLTEFSPSPSSTP